MPDGTAGNPDRLAKRELLWNRWAELSPTVDTADSSVQETAQLETNDTASAKSVAPAVVEWTIEPNNGSKDEAVNGCGCW